MDKRNIPGYPTRLLVPLPPYPDLIEKVREKARKCFTKEPLYYESDVFEGYLIPWRTWYGFDGEDSVKVGRFRSHLENQLDEFFKDDYEKEALFVDWLGEDNFEYLDLTNRKQYSEIFSNRYENGEACITVYSDFLRITLGNYMRDVGFNDPPQMIQWIKGDAIPIFEKLKLRGLYDINQNYPDVGA